MRARLSRLSRLQGRRGRAAAHHMRKSTPRCSALSFSWIALEVLKFPYKGSAFTIVFAFKASARAWAPEPPI